MRGLSQNQINTPNSINEHDQRNRINIFGDSESVTLTHIGATQAFSKIQQYFQNRIPKELDQNFDIPRINMIY